MKLLIQGSAILAKGPFQIAQEGITADEAYFPAASMPGWVIVDVEVPADFVVSEFQWNGTSVARIPPPAAPVPESVSKFQAKAALLQAGLLDSVEAMMTAPQTPAVAKLAWSDAQEFRRQSPTVAAMTAALGLNEGQIDDLFRAAARIVA